MLPILITAQVAMLVWMGILYLVQLKTRNAGVVDAGWAAGLGIAVLFYAFSLEGQPARVWMVAALLILWAGRLALYIVTDRVWGAGEDRRYQAMRTYWGDKAGRNFFFFFEAQAFGVVLFSLPVLAAMMNPVAPLAVWDMAGVGVWLVSVLGECAADQQLRRHRENPAHRGVTCTTGLWRYSRHPNYFFEWLHWWTYVLLSVGSPWFWVSLLGPVAMLAFLLKLTGIPHTERQAMSSRSDYRTYQETTNKFFPWFPRKQPC